MLESSQDMLHRSRAVSGMTSATQEVTALCEYLLDVVLTSSLLISRPNLNAKVQIPRNAIASYSQTSSASPYLKG